MMTTRPSASGAFNPDETPLAILADGCFGQSTSKLALGVIRYGCWPITAVIDQTQAGKTVRDVTPLECDAPIVKDLTQAIALGAKALLIGTAPPGGQLPSEWRAWIQEALRQGLHVISGLHDFLTDDPELVALAAQHQARLWDVRDPDSQRPGEFNRINQHLARPEHVRVITMVGTDCSVGKMHTALELQRHSLSRGQIAGFVATGQTGILITGHGIPLDRVIADFMAGGLEHCLLEEVQRLEQAHPTVGQPHLIFVEGQGSLLHPAYSGVTLGLLHGSNPDALILCHRADLHSIRNYRHVSIPSLDQCIRLYEEACNWARPHTQPTTRVRGLAINTVMLTEAEAQAYLHRVQAETGLPATDPVRYGVQPLLDALLSEFNSAAQPQEL